MPEHGTPPQPTLQDLPPDLAAARQFLDALGSGHTHCFQTFNEAPEQTGLVRVLHGSLDEHAAALINLNQRGAGTFVAVNKLEFGKRRRTENVREVRALFIDADDPTRVPEIERLIAQYGLKPSIVVESSPGKRHYYWCTDDCSLDQFQAAQRHLAGLFGTDGSVCDLPRLMRVPGFIHWKDVPFRSRLLQADATGRYAYNDLAARFGISAQSSAGPSSRTSPNAGVLLGAPSAHQIAIARKSVLNNNARAALVKLLEIEAASDCIRDTAEFIPWRDRWALPMAAVFYWSMPDQRQQLYEIFDRVNERTADPAKVSAKYLASARAFLDRAVHDYPNRPEDKRYGRNKILQIAFAAGWDGYTHAYREALKARQTSAPFFVPVPFDRVDLGPVAWLVDGLLLRGEITVLAGQGAGAKTALSVHVAVSLAAGLSSMGPFKVDNRPEGLNVALISAEEDRNRIGLLVAAACQMLSLDPKERALVRQNLSFHDAQASGWRLGQPPPNQRRDVVASDEQDQSLRQLIAALSGIDLLVLDTLAALFNLPNENDNAQATLLMRRLARAARDANCAVLLLHHTPKVTRETAAQQRGEPTLVRGGGALVNSPRVVLTVTSLPAAEVKFLLIQNRQADRVRRLEHVKINDMPPMEPAYIELVSEPVKVRDGTEVSVRAVRFIQGPTAAGGIFGPIRNAVLDAIDKGVQDRYGARVPLTQGSGNRTAVPVIAGALKHANPILNEHETKQIARAALKNLVESDEVLEQEVRLPQYDKKGRPNGTQRGQGLATRRSLAAPASAAGPGQPEPPLATPQETANASTTSAEPAAPPSDPPDAPQSAQEIELTQAVFDLPCDPEGDAE